MFSWSVFDCEFVCAVAQASTNRTKITIRMTQEIIIDEVCA